MKYSTLIKLIVIPIAFCPGWLQSQNIYHLGEGLKTNGIIYAIEYDSINSRIYVGGFFTQIDNVDALNIAFYENEKWHPLDKGVDGPVTTLQLGGDHLYVGGVFENASGVTTNQIARWDGLLWSALQGDRPFNGSILSLEWFQEKLYATGQFTRIGNDTIKGIAKWDGHQWRDAGLDHILHAKGLLAVNDTLWAYGSAYQSLMGHFHLASYLTNGQWTTLPRPEGFPALTLSALIRFQNNLYAVAGDNIVKRVGSEWVNYGFAPYQQRIKGIFVFDGKMYSILKPELNSYQFSIMSVLGNQTVGTFGTSSPIGGIQAYLKCGDDLWVGGDFVDINGTTFLSMASFNGASWTDRGHIKAEGYVNGYNNATGSSILGEDLIVGGEFLYADTTFARHIARWNGTHWEAMGEGFDAPVSQVITFKNEIYACGSFIKSGNLIVNRIAKWDGARWQALSQGADRFVKGMIVWNENLYVWGNFLRIGNSGADYFAKFDGVNWSQVYGPWVQETQPVFDVEEWNGKLNATYLWSKPIRLNIDGSWAYVGSEEIGEGRLFNYREDLYFGDTRVLKFESPNWIDLNFPEVNSWDSPHFLEMNDQLFCSITNIGLFRYDVPAWSYLSYIQPYSSYPIGDDRYAITGFFPEVYQATCQTSSAFNHVAILEFRPPEIDIKVDTNRICKNETVTFIASSNALYLEYNWEFEGGIPAYATDECPVVQYNESGLYYAKLIGSNAEGADTTILSLPIEVLEDCLTNSSTVSENRNTLNLYPNPVSDFLYLDMGSIKTEDIIIFNVSGINFPAEPSPHASGNILTIDVTFLPPGIYFITLKGRSGPLTQRFVKW